MRTPAGLIFIATVALAACDERKKADALTSETQEMETASRGKEAVASAQGKVVAIDRTTPAITIAHGSVPEVDWPAMTMSFDADPAAIEDLSEGDEVEFRFRMTDDGSEIVSIGRN